MKIKDIEDFRSSDAIKFHDQLNPLLFTDEEIQPDVREQLMRIAEDFIEFMGIDSLKVTDVRLYGSNAAYTYTKFSDIDLHILVDMNDISDEPIYRELFTAKKKLYNDSLDITVRGLPVELYMQGDKDTVKSLGDYSIMRNRWVKLPKKAKASFEENSVVEKFKRLVVLSELALRSNDLKLLDSLLSTIKRYRQAGLEEGGEFSPENLAYKSLRNHGTVEKLYKHRDRLHSEELSIDEDDDSDRNDESHLFDQYNQFLKTKAFDFADAPTYESYSSSDDVRRNYEQKILRYVWESRGLVSATSVFRDLSDKWNIKKVIKESTDDNDLQHLLDFCFGELDPSFIKPGKTIDVVEVNIPTDRVVQFSLHENVKIKQTQIDSDGNVMILDDKGRVFIQGYFAHQRVEYRFMNRGAGSKGLFVMRLKVDHIDGDSIYKGWRITFSNESFADRMNRRFRESKDMMTGIHRNVYEDGDRQQYIEIEFVGADPRLQRKLYKGLKAIPGVTPILQGQGDHTDSQMRLSALFKDPNLHQFVEKTAKDIGVKMGAMRPRSDAYVRRAKSGKLENQLMEASGYIPSYAEKNDPRFKTALSIDIDPDIMPRQAAALGLGSIKRDGRPQRANPSGKFKR